MLQAVRAALQRGELDQAEKLARAADQSASAFTFPIWGDTPSKTIKDIQAARTKDKETRKPADKASERASHPVAETKPAEVANADKARGLIQRGRTALAAGNLAEARKCAEQAGVLKADLHWSEDNPAKLLNDVARADAARKGALAAPATPAAKAAAPAVHDKEDALALLHKGREQLSRGELDEAAKTAACLRAAKQIHWGLFFEDTPDKFQGDVDRACAQHNKEKSVEVLAEVRRHFDKKDYSGTEKLAYEAQKLHGPYSIWDLGDRPSKLLADVQSQKQKERRLKLPDPPVVAKGTLDTKSHGPLASTGNGAVAQNTPPGMNNSTKPPIPPAGAERRSEPFNPLPAPTVAEARRLLGEARIALGKGDTTKARLLADQVRDMHVVLNKPGEESPESIYREIEHLSSPRTPAAGALPGALLAGNPPQAGTAPGGAPRRQSAAPRFASPAGC